MEGNCAKTLTEGQMRKSLSSQKKSKTVSRGVRNVLARAYLDYWPVVNGEAENEVKGLLDRLLPSASKPVCDELEASLRKMLGQKNKEERLQIRQQVWDKNPFAKELRMTLALGINDVSRCLEANELASLLVASEADPPILTRHLGTLAATRCVPYLVLPGLKACAKASLHFACLALGLKKSIESDEDHHFYPLHKKICDVSREMVCGEMVEKSSVKNQDSSDVLPQIVHEPSKLENPSTLKTCAPSDIYLFRKSKTYRAFVPGKGLVAGPNTAWDTFLSLSGGNDTETSIVTSKVSWEPLGLESVSSGPSLKQAKSSAISVPSNKNIPSSSSTSEKVHVGKRTVNSRYYDADLVPLKVKRMQGNPVKINQKKTKKKKTK